MVAPTAKIQSNTITSEKPASIIPNKKEEEDDDVLIDSTSATTTMEVDGDDDTKTLASSTAKTTPSTSFSSTITTVTLDQDGKPKFSSVANTANAVRFDKRSVRVPPHRMTPLKNSWIKVYEPLVNHLKLQVRMDTKRREVQIRTCSKTTEPSAVQRGEDFLRAFMTGFDIDDAVALLRLNDLYTETFEVKDVKTLTGDHLSRAIGRIAGKDGKTKYAIENATRTRIVLADSKIHILGGFENVKIARETVVSLILGSPPSKVYGNLRIISSRLKERY